MEKEITYEEALAECIQHYIDRGNPEDLAIKIVGTGEKWIFDLYDMIQEEKKLPIVTYPIDLAELRKEREKQNNEPDPDAAL